MSDWRDDPTWCLVEVDEAWAEAAKLTLTHRPLPAAELAQPDAWASVYERGRAVATWSRLEVRPTGVAGYGAQ